MTDSEPQGVMAMLGDAGPAPTVTHKGKTWTVGHPTQRAKAELEKLVVEVARANLADLRAALPPADWQAEKERLSGLLLSRAWQTFGTLWAEVCNGPQSFALFLLSLARAHHPEMTLADAESLWLDAHEDCKLALAMVVPGFFDLLAVSLPGGAADRRAFAEGMRAEAMKRLAPPTPTA